MNWRRQKKRKSSQNSRNKSRKVPLDQTVVKAKIPQTKSRPEPYIAWRFNFILIILVFILIGLIARAAYMQIINPYKLIEEGNQRSVRIISTAPLRGNIYDRNGKQLASSTSLLAVVADPRVIFKNEGLTPIDRWQALAKVLDLDFKTMSDYLEQNRSRSYLRLKREVRPEAELYIRKLDLMGIEVSEEQRRFYPAAEISSHIIGVTGDIDKPDPGLEGVQKGQEGIERRYNQYLTGKPGWRKVRRDRLNRVVAELDEVKAQNGQPIYLSIDQRIQAVAYRAVKQAVSDNQATSGSAVVIDVRTGEVLALVNSPSYNPNNREDLQTFKMRNRAITDMMEPGSTVKPFTILTALENNTVNLNTTVEIPGKTFKIGGGTVTDSSRIDPIATLQKIIQKSSNIGACKISLSMPIETFLQGLSRTGFGEATGINLIGESYGFLPNRKRWSIFERATLGFGYGLAVTPVQLARAYAALGSGGILRPLSIIKLDKPEPGVRIFPEKYVQQMILMMETVTQPGGTATKAAVRGYRVAAKSGTSQVATAGGYSNSHVGLTAGVAPVSDPRLAIVVMINEPKMGVYYGGAVAGPVFSEILRNSLRLLNIPPDADTAVSSPYSAQIVNK